MQEDLANGKETEVRWTLGELVRLGRTGSVAISVASVLFWCGSHGETTALWDSSSRSHPRQFSFPTVDIIPRCLQVKLSTLISCPGPCHSGVPSPPRKVLSE